MKYLISVHKIWRGLILLCLISVALLARPSHAQEIREGIGIAPTTITVSADPGQRLRGEFTVLNDGNQALRYRVYVSEFGITNEEYEKDFEEPIPGGLSPVSWFEVPGEVRELAPGTQEKLPYSITVPDTAVPRGYYAVIFAETFAPEPDATGVARIKRVGSLVYLTVKGGSVEQGNFLGFETARWYKQQPLTSHIRVQNEGNVHFDVTGEVRLKDVFGRTVSLAPVNGTLLPSTIRKFSPELSMGLPFGVYKIEGEVGFLGQTVSLGPHWVFVASPFWLAVSLLIVLAWIILLVLWVKRRARHKKSK